MCQDVLHKIALLHLLFSLLALQQRFLWFLFSISSSWGGRGWQFWSVWWLGWCKRKMFCQPPLPHSLPLGSPVQLQWAKSLFDFNYDCITAGCPLAHSTERCANNAKVVSSTLTRTTTIYFVVLFVFRLRDLKHFKADVCLFFHQTPQGKPWEQYLNHHHSWATCLNWFKIPM